MELCFKALAFSASLPVGSTQSAASRRCPRVRCAVPGHELQPKTRPTGKARKYAQNALIAKFVEFKHRLQELEELSRPGAQAQAAGEAKNRFDALPESIKGRNQMLGRMSPGCEGTHGVFPKCNFRCKPCYHSEDANSVRIDGTHTVTNIARQMDFLQKQRGRVAHCQLIGGEVSLLPAADHARALEVMRFYGRIPMSFTHGDFSYDYLKALALDDDGKPRFRRLDFAVHFDMFMYGRTGIRRPESEAALHEYRARFVEMFRHLEREHGVRSYLAHNVTVQEGNFDQIADVVRELRTYGFRMLSFQPAAATGHRRAPRLARDDGEGLWAQIEKGAGTALPTSLFQMGDPRCNRVSFCAVVGDGEKARVVPLFDAASAGDQRLRDALMERFGNIALPHAILWLKGLRVLLRRPWLLFLAFSWFFRFARRCGDLRDVLFGRCRLITFVMHRFMDADDVRKAWALMEAGHDETDEAVASAGPRVLETVERLRACSYGMAQVEQGRIVPACVQHSVFDADENKQLAQLLRTEGKERAAMPPADEISLQ